MPRKKTPSRNSLEEINQFGPFCHGTSSSSGREIDNTGRIKPRGKILPSRYEEAGFPSFPDRVYLASIPQHVGSCLDAMINAVEQDLEIEWLSGAFYILEKIPEELLEYLHIDEDCKIIDETCQTPLESLKAIGSVSIKTDIPSKYFKKMSPKEFYYFIREYYPEEIPQTWSEFVAKRIQDREGESAVLWMKKKFPKLFED